MHKFTLIFSAILVISASVFAAEEFNLSLTGGDNTTYVWAKTEGTTADPFVTLKSKKALKEPVIFFSKEISESNFETPVKLSGLGIPSPLFSTSEADILT